MLVEHVPGNPELLGLDLVGVRDDPALEHVARTGHRRQSRGHEPAGARLGRAEREAALAAELQHDLLDRALVLREQVALERLAQPALRARRLAARLPAPRSGRRGSRSRARRSSPRRRRRRPPRRRAPARRRTRSPRRSAGRAARAGSCGRARGAAARSRARAARAGAAPRAGPAARRRRTCPCRARRPGAVPARPSETAPSGSVACLTTPGAKSAYGRRRRSATVRETRSISASSSESTSMARPATRATSSSVRSSCVGPSPPETRQTSACIPSRSASSSSTGSSPTMVTRAGCSPSARASRA